MLNTTYPTDFTSDDFSLSLSTTPMDLWSNGDLELYSSHDTLAYPNGNDLDAFEDHFYKCESFSSDMLSETPTTDDEDSILSTPPSPPTYYKLECSPMECSPVDCSPLLLHTVQAQQQQLYLQQAQQLMYHKFYQSLQSALLTSGLMTTMPWQYVPSTPQWTPLEPNSAVKTFPLVSEPSRQPSQGTSDEKMTSLDASRFESNGSSKMPALPMDISGSLSEAQYSKIFKKYHLALQLGSHPVMTEQDLEDVKVNGRIYFLKNVKTIVPKIGTWKFNAHISHRKTDERQYNIPGMAVTCKVKEWLTEDGLWRLYHYKRGKTVKPKKLSSPDVA